MGFLDKLLTVAYFLAAIAACLGGARYWLEWRKSGNKRMLLGLIASVCLTCAFFFIIVSVGHTPAWSAYILRVSIRLAVIGYAAFKLCFEVVHMSTFVLISRKTRTKVTLNVD